MVRLSNEIIDQFREDYISSDNMGTTLLILFALYRDDFDFLDYLDDSNKDKKMILLYRDLVYKGYLLENEDNEDGSNVHFRLTDKAILLIDSLGEDRLESKVEKPLEDVHKEYIINSKVVTPKAIELGDEDPILWIKDWLELFPTRGKSSYPLRSGSGNCVNKMRMFLKTHDYSKYKIFEATKFYLRDQEADGFRFTQTASNFISKAESGRGNIRNSTLETYCELIDNDSASTDSNQIVPDFNPFD